MAHRKSDETPDPAAAAAIAKAKRLMLVTAIATFVALAIILAIIGYRVSGTGGSGALRDALTVHLPAGARVVATGEADGKLAVTIELNGAIQVRLFDYRTGKPAGRIDFAPEP